MTDWKNRITGYGTEAPDQLLANPHNHRIHPRRQQDALSGSLETLGYIQTVIVNKSTGHIVDGHLRVTMALREGQAEIPVTYVELTEAEEAQALLSLDPIAAMAASDAEKVDELLRMIQTDDERVMQHLADLAKENGLDYGQGEQGDAEPQIDRAAELLEKWGCKPGDLWLIGEHRLLIADCTDAENIKQLMDGKQADCVFTSPPYAVGVDYGETYEDTIENLRAMLPKLSRLWMDVVTPGGFAVVNFGDIAPARNVAKSDEPCEYPMALEYFPVFRADGWLLWSRRVWCKPNARVNSLWCIGSNRAATDWEHIWTFRKPGEAIVKRVDKSQFGWFSPDYDPVEKKETHGAGMPVNVASQMLEIHSRPESVAYEPFLGTGTTMIAAQNLERTCYASEISPSFAAISLERMSQAFPSLQIRRLGESR